MAFAKKKPRNNEQNNNTYYILWTRSTVFLRSIISKNIIFFSHYIWL